MPDNLYLSALRTQSLPFRIEEYVNFRIVDIANDTIVKAIRDEAIAKKMPERYIKNIHSEFDGNELWIWVDFRGKKGEKLDLFFEEGTVDHPILPRLKQALSWVVGGIRYFSRGHWVSGIEARHVFREGLKKGYPEFKSVLKKDIEDYLQETSLFG